MTQSITVLVAAGSRSDRARLIELVTTLRASLEAIGGGDVVVSDRMDDEVTRRLNDSIDGVRVLCLPPETTLPGLRAAALAVATTDLVAVIADYVIPEDNWLESLLEPFSDADVVMVGGAVVDGRERGVFDRAAYLLEYGALAPGVTPSPPAPGMNVAYRRDALNALPTDRLADGLWEEWAHPLLTAAGTCGHAHRAVVRHARRFSVGFALSQRFCHSRAFAAQRFPGSARRWVAAAFTPILPLLLLGRFLTGPAARRRGGLVGLPAVCLLLGVGVIGEAVGYVCGAGHSLRRVE